MPSERDVLDWVAALLEDATVDPEARSVSGARTGQALVFFLTERDGAPWMEIVAEAPGPPIQLEMRPQTPEANDEVRDGLATDVRQGDPAFDRAFVVDVTPAGLGHVLFDEAARERML